MTYTQFFNLKHNPFRKDVPVLEMFDSKDWKELHPRLHYLQKCRGIGLVVGEPGVGKTTALRRYLEGLNSSLFHTCYFSLSTLTVNDFLRGLAMELGEEPSSKRITLIRQIQKAIETTYYERRMTPVIILDEMQMASTQLFEELRLLFNFKMDSENPFILILSAQPTIRSKLSLNIHYPLRQRILVKCYMTGLTKEDTGQYIETRIKLAGATDSIFTTSAIEAIHATTNGFPRVVNSIATNCLLYACEKKVREIDDEIVYQAQNEMNL